MQRNNRLLKLLLRLGVFLVFISIFVGVGIWIYDYLHTTTITVISASSNSYVSITPIKNGELVSSETISAKHKLSESVRFGTYQLAAFSGTDHLTRTVNIGSGGQKLFNLVLSGFSSTPYPVYGGSVEDVSASSSSIVFINSSSSLLSINSNNSINKIFGGAVSSIDWASPTQGVLRTSGGFYSDNNGVFSLLNLPFKYSSAPVVNYAVAGNGAVFISNGSVLYKGSISGGFQKIYSSSNTILQISASTNSVALIIGSRKSNPDLVGTLTIIKGSGVTNTNIAASSIGISPNGNYTAVMSNYDISIYSSSMDRVDEIAGNGSISSLAWGTNGNLFYSSGGTLWQSSISKNESFQISQTSGQSPIQGIYPDTEGNYVYISVANSPTINNQASGSQLYRVALHAQPQNYNFGVFSVIFPQVLQGECSVNYVNFTLPTLYIVYPGNVGQQICTSSVDSLLAQYGISQAGVTMVFQPQPVN